MPKTPRLNAAAAPLEAGFTLLRSKSSHRIYGKQGRRAVIPFHGSYAPSEVVKQVLEAIEESAGPVSSE